jgi:hypothetical protein
MTEISNETRFLHAIRWVWARVTRFWSYGTTHTDKDIREALSFTCAGPAFIDTGRHAVRSERPGSTLRN